MKSLSVSDAFSFAWDKFHKHTGISVGFTIAYFLIGYAIQVTPRVVDAIVANSSPLVYSIILIIVSLGVWLLGMAMQLGLYRFGLRFCDDEKPEIDDLFKEWRSLLYYILANLFLVVVVLLSFIPIVWLNGFFTGFVSGDINPIWIIIYVVVGFLLALRIQFFPYLIIDKGLGSIKSLKASIKITSGATPKLLLFIIVLVLINFLGALALLIGLLITIPVTYIALAYVYRSLLAQTELP